MVGFVVILTICLVLLLIYLIAMHQQMHRINEQLTKRSKDRSKQLVTISLSNRDLAELAANVNRALKEQERVLALEVHNEREFKQLIADISHDLRTPITAIRGYLQLMERGKLTENEKKNLVVARKYTEELGDLIEHFYEYSYLLDAKPEMNLESLNLTNLVIECIASAVNMFEEHNLSVEVIENPPVIACVDREMMVRIVQNLIRNCIAHSAGNVTVEIKQKERPELHFINPVKSDSKIDPQQIFNRFYTGDVSRHRTTGLGLSIVKLLAERMGGAVKAELIEGQIDIIIFLNQVKTLL